MDVLDAIRLKRSVRRFAPNPLPDDAIRTILNAGRRAQSSKNTQPWQFVAITEKDTLSKLSQTGDFAGHLAGAALGVALVAPDDAERHDWLMFDLGQAASYMQLAALELGI
ncbi:MAG TPA: nitroreductase family protein, partial [Ktedonobacterales bacterium]|nr:nitroreductase family protein [Ktedonobacterales bacterium]